IRDAIIHRPKGGNGRRNSCGRKSTREAQYTFSFDGSANSGLASGKYHQLCFHFRKKLQILHRNRLIVKVQSWFLTFVICHRMRVDVNDTVMGKAFQERCLGGSLSGERKAFSEVPKNTL